MWSPSSVIYAGALARVLMIGWGEFQDAFFLVKYTDVDYSVFTDAARHVAAGQTPFRRSTYRYSPLLSYILLPNIVVHPAWGKVLFSFGDILAAILLRLLAKYHHFTNSQQSICLCLWLFNPYTATISTRGSCDVLVTCMLLSILVLMVHKNTQLAAIVYGLAVHFRIYPIIYGPSLVLHLLDKQKWKICWPSLRAPLLFSILSAGTFAMLGELFYHLYGVEFLNEAFVYHLSRRDHRHNFSVFYYGVYLEYMKDATTTGWQSSAALAFGPHAALQLLFSWLFHKDLPLCWLLQTISFVAFNKVCTAQYFLWYFSLLPLVLVRLHGGPGTRLLLIAAVTWVATQLNWLLWAYLLEFQGLVTFVAIWASSISFLMANVFLLLALLWSIPTQVLDVQRAPAKNDIS